jgi:acyl carrier protein
MSTTVLPDMTLPAVRERIAALLLEHMDIPTERTLSDVRLMELAPNFDSLAFLESLILIDEAFGFDFDINVADPKVKLPTTVTELAQEVLIQWLQHQEKLALKQAQKQAAKAAAESTDVAA